MSSNNSTINIGRIILPLFSGFRHEKGYFRAFGTSEGKKKAKNRLKKGFQRVLSVN
jgi:hypothetical protein